MSDPTANLTLQELHEETGRLLASFLMPDTLTNVLSVKLDGSGVQRVTVEIADPSNKDSRAEDLEQEIEDLEITNLSLERDLADAEDSVRELQREIAAMKKEKNQPAQ